LCGIYGIVNPDQRLISSKDIQDGLNKIRHRGPDDEGYVFSYANNHIAARGEDTINHFSNLPHVIDMSLNNCDFVFGHRRLSIIDTSYKGHQPFIDDGYVIVYNGEIYNYIEIKKELQKCGYIFNTNSDTEVLLKAYIEWGQECQNKFIGIWAFAIYDPKKREVFLSRDRFGVKPLYYVVKDRMVIFASEIKSLISLPFISKEPDIFQVKRYLIWGDQEHLPETMFLNVKRLINSHSMTIKIGDGKIEEKVYYDLDYNPSKEKFSEKKAQEYSEKFSEIFTDAVRLQLRSDVKVGTTLSGGIDSSSIVYTINKLLKTSSIDSIGDKQYAQDLLNIQSWYNGELKNLNDKLAQKKSEALLKYQERVRTTIQKQQATNKPEQTTQQKPTQTFTQKTGETGEKTTESYHDILKIKSINKLDEATYKTDNVDVYELKQLKDYLDAENIPYEEDEEEGNIDFDKSELDKEWKDRIENIGLEEISDDEDISDIVTIEDEDEDDIYDIHKEIEKKKVFYVKVKDDKNTFIGKIYKLYDDDSWRVKVVEGESETFEKLNYDPDYDEIDIIAFLRKIYDDVELLSEDEYRDYMKNKEKENIKEYTTESLHKIPTFNDFLSNYKVK